MAKNGEMSKEKYKNLVPMAKNAVPCSYLRQKLKNTKIAENSSKWSKMAKNGQTSKDLVPMCSSLTL